MQEGRAGSGRGASLHGSASGLLGFALLGKLESLHSSIGTRCQRDCREQGRVVADNLVVIQIIQCVCNTTRGNTQAHVHTPHAHTHTGAHTHA